MHVQNLMPKNHHLKFHKEDFMRSIGHMLIKNECSESHAQISVTCLNQLTGLKLLMRIPKGGIIGTSKVKVEQKPNCINFWEITELKLYHFSVLKKWPMGLWAYLMLNLLPIHDSHRTQNVWYSCRAQSFEALIWCKEALKA